MKEDCAVISLKFRIAVFTFSPSAAESIKKAAKANVDDVDLELYDQGLEEAVPVAQALAEQGVEVIVSRRGTSALMRESLRIPIISFPVTSLDILTTIKQAAKHDRKILFPAFRKKIPGLEIVEDLMGIELLQYVYSDSKSLDETFVRASEKGCHVAVGGGVSKRLGRKRNFEVIEIQTSEAEIYSTLENAKSVAQSNRKERRKAQRFLQVIDSISEGVLAVDQTGQTIIMNSTARNTFQSFNHPEGSQQDSNRLSPFNFRRVMKDKEPLLNRVETFKGVKYVVNYFPILIDSQVIGAVSTFKDIDNVVNAENALRRSLTKGLIAKYHIENLIHASPNMKAIVEQAKRFAATDFTILITGETGTGKEILAQSIHNLSSRSLKPFVSVNCASLPDQLIESELFGYEQGAFTGAQRGGKPGLFEVAHTGSIFLDEICAMPHSVQTSLLRFLEQREVRRVGGDRLIPVDLRIISAANRNLVEEVHCGRFRNDLFHRLNVLKINIPSLRERPSDIPLLIEHFIDVFCAEHRKDPLFIPPAYLQKLIQYEWPGNVRQLDNFIKQLLLLCSSDFDEDIFDSLYSDLVSNAEPLINGITIPDIDHEEECSSEIRNYEARILKQALLKAKFSRSKAAKILGISRTTLWRKLKEANIDI